GHRIRNYHRDLSHLDPVSWHRALRRNARAESNENKQLGSLRHPERGLSTDRTFTGRIEARLRLGIPYVLSLEFNRQSSISALNHKAFAEALFLQRRMEKVRTRLGRGNPNQAVVTDAAGTRSGSLSGQFNRNTFAANRPQRSARKSQAQAIAFVKSNSGRITRIDAFYFFQKIAAVDEVMKFDGLGNDFIRFGLRRF